MEIIISASAVFVSFCALGLAVYEGRQTRKHNRLSVEPCLAQTLTETDHGFILQIFNRGLGPAVILDFSVYIEARKVPPVSTGEWFVDWMRQYGLECDEDYVFNFGTINVNQKMTIIDKEFEILCVKGRTPEVGKLINQKVLPVLTYLIKYSSMYKDKSRYCGAIPSRFLKSESNTPRPIVRRLVNKLRNLVCS